MNLIVLKQWFLTRGQASRGTSINFQRSASFYGLYNIESLINKFTNKYTCFCNLFNVRGLGAKDDYFEGGVVSVAYLGYGRHGTCHGRHFDGGAKCLAKI